jgi:hypothetical protein
MDGQGEQIARYGKRVLGYKRFIPKQSHEAHWKTSWSVGRLNVRNGRMVSILSILPEREESGA